MPLNSTHDPALGSWVESANVLGCDFPIQNLPHGVFRLKGSDNHFRGGVAIGDEILDLQVALALGVFDPSVRSIVEAAGASQLNELMRLGADCWHMLRAELSRLLAQGAKEADVLRGCLVGQEHVEYGVPAAIGDYSDFFASWQHMVNGGRIFQPDAPPLPNFQWLPIAYHGRSSSIETSGTRFARPRGITRAPAADKPEFVPTRRLDYEMELGFWIGPGNTRGRRISIDDAEQHIFGVSLLNDWSARDVQAFEMTPLGPFLSKSFVSTISPWIVTLEALEPYRCELIRGADAPATLPHLMPANPLQAFDIQLEVDLQTQKSAGRAFKLSRTSFRHCYWSMAQMLTHHTEGGCNMRPGDFLGTGTQSGPNAGEEGSLLELSRNGSAPVTLPNGEIRSFLEDGDTVLLKAWAEADGAARIGFGECCGTVLPATGQFESTGRVPGPKERVR